MSSPPVASSYATCSLATLSAHAVLHLGRIMRSLGGRGEPGGSLIPFQYASKSLLHRLAEVFPVPLSSIPLDVLEEARQGLRRVTQSATELLHPQGERIPPALLHLDGIRCALRQLTDSLAIQERLDQGETVLSTRTLPEPSSAT